MVVSCWRGRISRRELHEHLDAIAGLPLRTDGACELLEVVRLALLHRVTVHDAAYLELALRREGVLATLDRVLLRAAAAAGNPTIPPAEA